jgi:hypothetical protein
VLKFISKLKCFPSKLFGDLALLSINITTKNMGDHCADDLLLQCKNILSNGVVLAMTKKPKESSLNSLVTSPSNDHKTAKKKALSRKEKFEASQKANQAMMKVWKLISQRSSNSPNAKDYI